MIWRSCDFGQQGTPATPSQITTDLIETVNWNRSEKKIKKVPHPRKSKRCRLTYALSQLFAEADVRKLQQLLPLLTFSFSVSAAP